jgi:hypothetical protein
MQSRRVGTRAWFFAAICVVCLLLYYPTPADLRGVPLFGAGLAAFWAIALAIQDLTTHVPEPRAAEPAVPAEPTMPVAEPEEVVFAPPPVRRGA